MSTADSQLRTNLQDSAVIATWMCHH